ncbi:MAG: acetyl-CoA carboxylase biotin carboxyl carrier protein [Balneolales bacterium]
MDLKIIKNLLNLISESDVNEVSIEEGDFKIKIKKKPDVVKGQNAPVYMPSPVQETILPAAGQPQQESSASQGGKEPTPAKNEPEPASTEVIKSPIVGTFYSASSPDADAYVKVGDTIKKGDTLCIVEAMKIMNEIEAEVSGKIVEKLAQDAQPVEFDQPLFIIEPS